MPGPVWRARRALATLRGVVPYLFEASLAALCLQVGLRLLTDQEYFDRAPAQFAWLVRHVASQEWQFGAVAVGAATLKVVGLLFSASRREAVADAAFLAREVGWGLSLLFWACLGVSFWIWKPWSIGAGTASCLAVLSLAMVVSGPVMPDEDGHARR